MQVFHRGGAEDNEDTHPQSTALKRNRFHGHFFSFLLGLVSGGFISENDGVQKNSQNPQDQPQFNEKHREVFCIVRDSLTRLGHHGLTDVVEINPAGKQNDHQDHAHYSFVLLIKRFRDRPDVLFGHGRPQSWRHGHNKES